MEKDINFQDIKVLYVENDIKYVNLVMAYLGNIGCESDFALDGKEAVDKVKSNKYDICFMDIDMESMGGLEATKIIRKDVNKDLPIIALTGTITEEDKEICFQAGMNDFVTKPVSKETIEAKIIQYTNVENLQKEREEKEIQQRKNGVIIED